MPITSLAPCNALESAPVLHPISISAFAMTCSARAGVHASCAREDATRGASTQSSVRAHVVAAVLDSSSSSTVVVMLVLRPAKDTFCECQCFMCHMSASHGCCPSYVGGAMCLVGGAHLLLDATY